MRSNCSFRWHVPAQGFHWIDYEDSEPTYLTPRVTGSDVTEFRSLMTREYYPLKQCTGLFRDFAFLATVKDADAKEAVLEFANKYGALSTDTWLMLSDRNREDFTPLDNEETFVIWWREIITMNRAVAIWDGICSGDGSAFAEFILWKDECGHRSVHFISHPVDCPADLDNYAIDFPDFLHQEITPSAKDKGVFQEIEVGDNVTAGRYWLKQIIEEHLAGKLAANMAILPDSNSLALDIVPVTLLAALWFQFSNAITLGRQYRSCQLCKTWYELSPETARTSRLFCSDACKSKAYRQKQDRARQMFAKDKSFREIAQELGSDVPTVKRWITGMKV